MQVRKNRERERERAVASQTPWSGLKCCQWQSDVPLNRIILKVSCHHIPASHYQGQGGPLGWQRVIGQSRPPPKRARAPCDATQTMKKRKNRWGVIGPMAATVMKLRAERNTWAVAVWRHNVTNQQWIAESWGLRRLCSPSWQIHCQSFSHLSHHRRPLAKSYNQQEEGHTDCGFDLKMFQWTHLSKSWSL